MVPGLHLVLLEVWPRMMYLGEKRKPNSPVVCTADADGLAALCAAGQSARHRDIGRHRLLGNNGIAGLLVYGAIFNHQLQSW